MSLFGTAAVALFLAGATIYVVILYNELVGLRNENDRAFANIDVLLKQRHDEIPNLVSCVKGYMDHERQTLEAVALARTASIGAASIPQKAQADVRLTGALHTLFAVAERYPDLKSNQNFLTLQSQLEGTENRIAVERMRYSEAVRDYNTRLRLFPGSVVASLRGFKEKAYFEAAPGSQEAPKVKF